MENISNTTAKFEVLNLGEFEELLHESRQLVQQLEEKCKQIRDWQPHVSSNPSKT